ncbi:MAG: DUF523 domain-containing protein [Planctomycetota bacterium]|nr:DUF523 domain-containing protein [Planctomycetota bacterium]
MCSRSSRACKRPAILVSACLLGHRTRYDGASKPVRNLPLSDLVVVSFCPEQDGGLPTPRPVQMLSCGDGAAVLDGSAKVINCEGVDVSEQFIAGAKKALELAKQHNASAALVKGRSPSCGGYHVWVDGKLVNGTGVATALLRRNGITCIEVN